MRGVFARSTRRMRYDVIWLEKEALPWLPTWIEIARLEGIPYVVDYDDAWFHRYENHWLSPLLGRKIDAVMQRRSYGRRRQRLSGAARAPGRRSACRDRADRDRP